MAVDERSTMFYGTSTSPGAKCLDSVFFLMNPRPEYSVHFLEPVRTDNPRGSIEGAHLAFARVTGPWAKMKATEISTTGPPKGKDHRRLEKYFSEVLEGAHIVEGQCSKDIIFE